MKFKSFAFTLIEMTFVLGLLAIMCALAFPSLLSFLHENQQKVGSLDLLQAVQLTRNEAMSRGESIVLCKSSDRKKCGGEWRQGYLIRQGNKILFSHQSQMSGQLYLRVFGVHEQELVFLPTGFPDAENGTFWYCEVGSHAPAWALVINRSGRARLIYSAMKEEATQSLKCV